MARPTKKRRICEEPSGVEFLPGGRRERLTVIMFAEEYEALRLIDYLGLTQEEAARRMGVARTTVQSIYEEARRKTADALVNRKRLTVEGGSYIVCKEAETCCGKKCGGRMLNGGCGEKNRSCPQCCRSKE